LVGSDDGAEWVSNNTNASIVPLKSERWMSAAQNALAISETPRVVRLLGQLDPEQKSVHNVLAAMFVTPKGQACQFF